MILRRLSIFILVLSVFCTTVVTAQTDTLKVVATYSILGDIVHNIAGENVDLTVLVGPDGDSHVYEPTPQDLIALAEADLIFENGFEFETWLDDLYVSSGSTAARIVVSDGIEPLAFEAHNEEVHVHENESVEITDLSLWEGESISIWGLDETELQPAITAILQSTSELTLENILRYIEEGNYTSFDTLTVQGQSVTFTSDADSMTCPYIYAGHEPVIEFPTATWYLFATSDETCADYRYLLLMPPHAAETGSIPHYHMRYGATDLEGLVAQGAPWYPSLYPVVSDSAAIMNSWVVNARMIGLYIATAYGIDVTLSEEEMAAQESAAAPVVDVELAPRRLLVADGVDSTVSVVDLESGDVLATYELSASAAVYTSPSGRYGFAVQTDGNSVNVIDSGVELEPHEDHYHTHFEEPTLLDFAFEGPVPIHFVIHDGQIVVFTDDNGTATLFTEANITDASVPLLSFVSEAPHHGVGVALGDMVLLSHFDPSGEDLPNGIDVLDLEGHVLQTFDGCDQLHGEAPLENGAAFACEQGVLVIERDGNSFTSSLIAYPDDGRAWGLIHDKRSPYLFGDFGEKALVRVDVAVGTSEVITIPEALWEFRFHPDDASKLLTLTTDGSLNVIDAASGTIESSVQVVDAFTIPEEWGEPRPSLATIPGHTLVSDPITGRIFTVHLADMEVEGSYKVNGVPVALTAFGYAPVADEEHHHEDDTHGHSHGEFDPHIWHDPNNAIVMVNNIRDALVDLDTAHRDQYEANAEAYISELTALDQYIRDQVATIPEANRVLVTSHDTFGYFADEYGFEVMNVLGSVSTEAADPGAGQIVELVHAIQESNVPALFAENIINPGLVEQVAAEAGVSVAPMLYTDALGQSDTPADTYLNLLRYNIDTITAALQ